jgi:osmoprotectant transport system permease protein
MPSIIAGLRLATVSTIELAVIGGFVGLNGYGKYLNDGLDRDYHPEVVTYLLLTVLLAVVADLLILALGRALTRWRQAT